MSVTSLPMNFRLTLAERVRAASGVPAYARRKRRIEDLEAAILLALGELHRQAHEDFPDEPCRAETEFERRARDSVDLRLLNDLIARHNEYFPIEANLRIDLQTGQSMYGNDPWEPLPAATLDELIDRLRKVTQG